MIKGRVIAKSICTFAMSLCLLTSSVTAMASDTSASVIRLEQITGTVKVTDSAGNPSQIIDKMRLNNEDDVNTFAKSYAYISLDASKAVKMDAKSEAYVKKNKKKYELVLESGNLIFDVSSPLQSSESMQIKTTNMTMGIRGTCAQVQKVSKNFTRICLLDGTLDVTVKDPDSGKSQSVVLNPGDAADCLTGEIYGGCTINVGKVVFGDLRGFALQHLLTHPDTCQRIYEQSGLDFRNLTQQQVNDRLSNDEVQNLAPASGVTSKDYNGNTTTGGG
jgi:hypothetical protein